MARKAPEHKMWPGIEVAITGAGVSPECLPAGKLVELIDAAVSVFRAIVGEQGLDVDELRLVQVRKGSAAYVLRSPDPRAGRPIAQMEQLIRTRGLGASEAVRRGIERMCRVGNQYGQVRFTRLGPQRREKPLFVVPPMEAKKTVSGVVESGTELYAVVAGVVAQASENFTVRLRLDDGASQIFPASKRVARSAAGLFLKSVRASVVYVHDEKGATPFELEHISLCDMDEDQDLVGTFASIRAELARDGVRIKASDWASDGEDD